MFFYGLAGLPSSGGWMNHYRSGQVPSDPFYSVFPLTEIFFQFPPTQTHTTRGQWGAGTAVMWFGAPLK